jgi:hypothetical protein
MIVHEEMGRWKVRGFDDGVLGGMIISAPTVLNFGSPALKQKVRYQGIKLCLHDFKKKNNNNRLFLKFSLVESVFALPLVNLMQVAM